MFSCWIWRARWYSLCWFSDTNAKLLFTAVNARCSFIFCVAILYFYIPELFRSKSIDKRERASSFTFTWRKKNNANSMNWSDGENAQVCNELSKTVCTGCQEFNHIVVAIDAHIILQSHIEFSIIANIIGAIFIGNSQNWLSLIWNCLHLNRTKKQHQRFQVLLWHIRLIFGKNKRERQRQRQKQHTHEYYEDDSSGGSQLN